MPGDLQARLEALDREWDVERVLQTNASVIVLAGLALAQNEATVGERVHAALAAVDA